MTKSEIEDNHGAIPLVDIDNINQIRENNKDLYYKFSSMYSKLFSQEELDALFDFLKNNKKYDPEVFWTQKIEDKKSAHPLLALAPNSIEQFNKLAEFCENEIANCKFDVSLYDTPDNEGSVILHYLWKSAVEDKLNMSSFYSSVSSLYYGSVLKVMEKTSISNWTWLDKEGQHPGDGWVRAIIKALKGDNQDLNSIALKISSNFPRNEKANVSKSDVVSSPWFSANDFYKVKVLLNAGNDINDNVKLSKIQMPAWEYLYLKLNEGGFGSYKAFKNMGDKIKDQGKLDTFKESDDKWKKALVPSDRRAKIGYVKSVIAMTGSDNLGRTSLDYLFRYRNDLIPLFFTNSFDIKKDRLEEMVGPDKEGFGLLTRLLCQGQYHPNLVKWMEAKNLPIKWGFEDIGLFAAEVKNESWFDMLSGRYKNRLSTKNLIEIQPDKPDFLFGPKEQQLKWTSFLDKIIDKMEFMSWKGLPNNLQTHVSRIVLSFVQTGELWKDQMDAKLFSQLQFLSWVILGVKDVNIFKASGIYDNHPGPVSLSIDPPSIWTDAMKSYMSNRDIVFSNHIPRYIYKSQPDEIKEMWKASFDKYVLNEAINPILESKEDKSPKLRKI